MTVNLGMPTPPVPTLAPRRKTHQIKVGDVLVGGDAIDAHTDGEGIGYVPTNGFEHSAKCASGVVEEVNGESPMAFVDLKPPSEEGEGQPNS